LRIIDKTETLEDPGGFQRNLNLTYATRDGIVCHCGEVDENALVPRDECIDLNLITKANEYSPYTWEGCVVKIADKISYLGRDIEDALVLKILDKHQLRELSEINSKSNRNKSIKDINNTIVMHNFIIDLCENSSPEHEIRISDSSLKLMNCLKKFNYENIYLHKRLDVYKNYASLVIESIFNVLESFFDSENTFQVIDKHKSIYPLLISSFSGWLLRFNQPNERNKESNVYKNEVLYDIFKHEEYILSVVDYISGMTDSFAVKIFHELTSF
jgi:dGTPase